MVSPKIDDSFIIFPNDPVPPYYDTEKPPIDTATSESEEEHPAVDTDRDTEESDVPTQDVSVENEPNTLDLGCFLT
ncbi:MAG: hypothetical protein E7672_01190 [Ruminococcaceae bacterium]|nr:hypothetical protein [Oscillospiraceae bacterium]